VKIAFGYESGATPGMGASARIQWSIFSARFCRTAFDRGKEPSYERIAPVLSDLVAVLANKHRAAIVRLRKKDDKEPQVVRNPKEPEV